MNTIRREMRGHWREAVAALVILPACLLSWWAIAVMVSAMAGGL